VEESEKQGERESQKTPKRSSGAWGPEELGRNACSDESDTAQEPKEESSGKEKTTTRKREKNAPFQSHRRLLEVT